MFNFLKRDVLIGVGVGFIISGIMVSAFGIGEPTDDQIKERAAQLGMVETIESLKGHDDSSQKELPKPAPRQTPDNSAKNNKNKDSETVAATGSGKLLPESDSTGTEQTTGPAAKPVSADQKISFEVRSGMGSETIAKRLEEKRVVKDRSEFYRVVTAHRAHSSFRTGVFKLPVGGDMEEILRILTGK